MTKNADATWGKEPGMRSNLDHVMASDRLTFREFEGAEVDVRGWPKLSNTFSTDSVEYRLSTNFEQNCADLRWAEPL
jgi:hypothetical protein